MKSKWFGSCEWHGIYSFFVLTSAWCWNSKESVFRLFFHNVSCVIFQEFIVATCNRGNSIKETVNRVRSVNIQFRVQLVREFFVWIWGQHFRHFHVKNYDSLYQKFGSSARSLASRITSNVSSVDLANMLWGVKFPLLTLKINWQMANQLSQNSRWHDITFSIHAHTNCLIKL